jgi:uncharacterized membrane protein YkvA (DUF1232 family)
MPMTATQRGSANATLGPAQALMALAARLPAYLRLAWGLGRDPEVPSGQKVWLLAAGLYNLSPLDPIPGFIPVLGQLDDYAVLLLALRRTLSASPPDVARAQLDRQGLTAAQLQADLAEIQRIGRSVGKQALRGLWAGARFAGRTALALGRAALRAARHRRTGAAAPPPPDPPIAPR